MLLKALTDGKVSSTGKVTVNSGIVGGVLISADGTNAAAVKLQKVDSNGDIIFDISTKQPMWFGAPVESGSNVYYSITGTNASAQIYEYVP